MDLDVAQLGQVFTPPNVVAFMLDLCRNKGRVLEPSAGERRFLRHAGPARGRGGRHRDRPQRGAARGEVGDFFAYPLDEQFDTIVGNPPYVRYQDVARETKKHLHSDLFDARSNLFLFFIEKAVRHLRPGGELVFIVPREFIKLTAAKKLNTWLYAQGSITHFYETGDVRVFNGATPNCAIFRFEKGRFDRRMTDGRIFTEVDGQLMFLRDDHRIRFADVFTVKVGPFRGPTTCSPTPRATWNSSVRRRWTPAKRGACCTASSTRTSINTKTSCSPAGCASLTKATGVNLPGQTQTGLSAAEGLIELNDGPHYDAAGGVGTLMIGCSQGQLDLLNQSYEALRESVYAALILQTLHKGNGQAANEILWERAA